MQFTEFPLNKRCNLILICYRFLSNPEGDLDMKQWGTEGLAYLSLDADVKEELVHDSKSLKAVIEAALVSIIK